MFKDTGSYQKFKNVEKTTKYGITALFSIENWVVMGGSFGADSTTGKVQAYIEQVSEALDTGIKTYEGFILNHVDPVNGPFYQIDLIDADYAPLATTVTFVHFDPYREG